MEEKKIDFAEMIKASAEIRAKLNTTKKPPTSVKPLKFEKLEGDSALKQAIIDRINSANLTYSDLYNYCARMKNGDVEAGNKMGSNLINGLRNRHTMIDTTLSLLCDFLDYDIYFIPRSKEKKEEAEGITLIHEDGSSEEVEAAKEDFGVVDGNEEGNE